MAYLIGRISGCHINPAVTIGMIATKKLDAARSAPYFVGQFAGGIIGAGDGKDDSDPHAGVTAAIATAGCVVRTSSTSRGYTLKPPLIIMSLARSTR